MWSPAKVQPPARPPHAQIENEDDQFLQVSFQKYALTFRGQQLQYGLRGCFRKW